MSVVRSHPQWDAAGHPVPTAAADHEGRPDPGIPYVVRSKDARDGRPPGKVYLPVYDPRTLTDRGVISYGRMAREVRRGRSEYDTLLGIVWCPVPDPTLDRGALRARFRARVQDPGMTRRIWEAITELDAQLSLLLHDVHVAHIDWLNHQRSSESFMTQALPQIAPPWAQDLVREMMTRLRRAALLHDPTWGNHPLVEQVLPWIRTHGFCAEDQDTVDRMPWHRPDGPATYVPLTQMARELGVEPWECVGLLINIRQRQYTLLSLLDPADQAAIRDFAGLQRARRARS
jgi:hypothetical protein